jgi:hypothetical protein
MLIARTPESPASRPYLPSRKGYGFSENAVAELKTAAHRLRKRKKKRANIGAL